VKLIFGAILKTNTTIEKENIVIIGVNATTGTALRVEEEPEEEFDAGF
jgi:hypothetical protein